MSDSAFYAGSVIAGAIYGGVLTAILAASMLIYPLKKQVAELKVKVEQYEPQMELCKTLSGEECEVRLVVIEPKSLKHDMRKRDEGKGQSI